jgi:hypothetical protein
VAEKTERGPLSKTFYKSFTFAFLQLHFCYS